MTRVSRRRGGIAVTAGTALALAACTTHPADSGPAETTEDAGATVTVRVWDEVAGRAYAESFDAFTAERPGITVEVEVVPWADYWPRLEDDLADGELADIFWTNAAGYARYADEGQLLDIGAALGDDHDEWAGAVTDLFSRNGTVWAVPQLWDSVALFYNIDLVEAAGVDPAALAWAPGTGDDTAPTGGQPTGEDAQPPDDAPAEDAEQATDAGDPTSGDAGEDPDAVGDAPADTLLDAARALTTDAAGRRADDPGFDPATTLTYGFNAEADLQAVYGNFLAQNGVPLREDDRFAFATPAGEEAFAYLVGMVAAGLAPPAEETNTDPGATRDLFAAGGLALLQTGSYDLAAVARDAQVDWALAPVVAGPQGPVGMVHGVAAAGNAATEDEEATVAVLRWLASADGQAALAGQGVAMPAAVGAQDDFVEYWADQDVDVRPFVTALDRPTVPAPVGPGVNAGVNAMTPVLHDMFLGAIPVPEALDRAQEAANEAE